MKKSRKIIKKEEYVKICPKCGSIDVQIDFSNPVVWAYGTTTKYKCNSCGHLGSLFPEVLVNEISNYKNRLKQTKQSKILQKRFSRYISGFFDWDLGSYNNFYKHIDNFNICYL